MFCPACGSQVPDDTAVCPVCANDLSAARQATQAMPPAQPPPQAYAVPPNQAMPVAPGPYQRPMPGAAPPRKSNAGLIIGIIVAVVVVGSGVLAVGGFFAYQAIRGRVTTAISADASQGGSSASQGGSSPETPGGSTSTDPGPAAAQTPAFTKTDAIDAVGTMLSGLKVNGGSLKAARAAATQRFKRANPDWIQRMSDFDFYVKSAAKKGDVWIVTTHEQWVSGAETVHYTVIVKNGRGLVDRRDGLN